MIRERMLLRLSGIITESIKMIIGVYKKDIIGVLLLIMIFLENTCYTIIAHEATYDLEIDGQRSYLVFEFRK